MSRVVQIEKVVNGYIVIISPIEDETFFDSWDDVVSYLKFYFDVKETDDK